MRKGNPKKVIEGLARAAIQGAQDSHDLYSRYIRQYYGATGRFAPGCDARDLLAWYEQNMPGELEAITKKKKIAS